MGVYVALEGTEKAPESLCQALPVRVMHRTYMNILSKLFGSAARVKILRLFLLNSENAYDAVDVAARANVSSSTARREIAVLEKIGFIKKKVYAVEVEHGRGKNVRIARRKVQGWTADPRFPYRLELQGLVINTPALAPDEVLKKLASAGKIKVLIVAGVFIREDDSRVDLLVVGDGLKNTILEHAVRIIESEVGKEIRYTAFETKEFQYRLGIYDKLIRDILDYPHQTVVDRLDLER